MRRTVLVTGASSGIGLATAVHVARLGFHTLASVRTAQKLDEVRAVAEREGVGLDPIAFDVADEEACQRAVAGLELFGLVNNAGYYNVGAIEDVPSADASRQLETMVVAPMRLARLALPAMRAAGQGRIVNVTSTLAHTSGPLVGWYQASKHALRAASDALRMEVASAGVEVVEVEPGGIDTEIWRKAEHDLVRHRVGSGHVTAYDRALELLHTFEGRMHPPSRVAEVVGEALTAGRPRRRYRVGAETALLGTLHAAAPRRLRDRVVRTALGL